MGASPLSLAAATLAATLCLPVTAALDVAQKATRAAAPTRIELPGGALVRSTEAQVQQLRTLALPGSSALALVWNETGADGLTTPWYAISLDGQSVATAQPTSYRIAMARASFDPLAQQPDLSGSPLSWDGEVYMVQFHTQVLADYRAALEELGAEIYGHLVHHTLVARMTPQVRATIEALEVVRWVGPFHPEYRLDPDLVDALYADGLEPVHWYNLAVYEAGLEQKQRVAAAVASLGGASRAIFPEGFRFEVELSAQALVAVMGLPEVAGVDQWGPAELDLDIVRQFSGANYLESQTGFTGQGVRGEVCDTGCDTTHPDLQHHGGVLLHGPNGTSLFHGTAVTGIVFGDGTSSLQARGILPSGKAVFARYNDIYSGAKSRYTHTAELLDPTMPYLCVFQTNSWGHPRTSFYNTISAEMDDILFQYDIVVTQAQGNSGNPDSRPEAWAKNIVSAGGIFHNNTLSMGDDIWTGASTGPATDGRIKPDLAHFYDSIFCLASGGGHAQFGGTSASTPLIVGHFGLFFQMWHNNVWNNNPTGTTVFESRPSARLARAALVNTPIQWTFSGTNHNLTRINQGWGAPDVAELYDTRNKTFFVDETDPVDNLGSRSYQLDVASGEPELKVTMVYRDPKALVFSGVHRINDLSLRVTSPGGTVYWGNNGLLANMWSTSGGSENHLDVIENVFVQNPQAGTWLVEILGTDINTDIRPEPGNNADFALWATGVSDPCPGPITYCTAKTSSILTLPKIGWTGTTSQAANDFVVTLADAVPNKNGIVFWGALQAAIPFQGGTLCLGGSVTRGPLVFTGATGTASFTETITAAMIGATRDYQWWFRDPAAAFGSGLSDGLEATFCP